MLSARTGSFDFVIVYKISDLIFGVAIEEICRSSSVDFAQIKSKDELLQIHNSNHRTLMICDLVSVKEELSTMKEIGSGKNFEILGFYPHVDQGTGSLALSLGIDYVVPRSAFKAKLKSLLS